jgi:hypothetical protein
MYALRVTCAVLHDFGLLTADLRRHVRPFARPRMAAIYLLLANSALMIQRVDSTNQEGQSSSCVRCFVLSESLPLRVKPNSPFVTFKGYKMADLAGPDRPKCGGSGAHISINMQRFRTGRHNAST